MTIHYSCVARGTTVLCSSQAGSGNYEDTLKSMLPNIPSQSDGKRTYTSNNVEFHCLIENGILFICTTNAGVSKQQPYGYLAEIKKQFRQGGFANRATLAGPGELDADFSSTLARQMQRASQNSFVNSSVATVQAQVDEVKGVMSQNIERVLERGTRLEDLMDKTEDLEAGAATFQRTARKIKKRYWWRNQKMTLIIICVVLVLITVITLIILFSTGVLPPSSSDDSDDDNKSTTQKP